jgi:hypothetical protein
MQTLSNQLVHNCSRSQYSCRFYADPLESADPQVFVGDSCCSVFSCIIMKSDGQQFHQYQQNKHKLLCLQRYMALEI